MVNHRDMAGAQPAVCQMSQDGLPPILRDHRAAKPHASHAGALPDARSDASARHKADTLLLLVPWPFCLHRAKRRP